jgi:hypothetical protein
MAMAQISRSLQSRDSAAKKPLAAITGQRLRTVLEVFWFSVNRNFRAWALRGNRLYELSA